MFIITIVAIIIYSVGSPPTYTAGPVGPVPSGAVAAVVSWCINTRGQRVTPMCTHSTLICKQKVKWCIYIAPFPYGYAKRRIIMICKWGTASWIGHLFFDLNFSFTLCKERRYLILKRNKIWIYSFLEFKNILNASIQTNEMPPPTSNN